MRLSLQCAVPVWQRLVWFKWMPTHTRATATATATGPRRVGSLNHRERTNERAVLPRTEDANRDDDDDGAGESVGIEWKRFSKTR